MVIDRANVAIADKYEVAYCLLAYLHFTVLKVKVKVMYNSTVNISKTVTDKANIVIANI